MLNSRNNTVIRPKTCLTTSLFFSFYLKALFNNFLYKALSPDGIPFRRSTAFLKGIQPSSLQAMPTYRKVLSDFCLRISVICFFMLVVYCFLSVRTATFS